LIHSLDIKPRQTDVQPALGQSIHQSVNQSVIHTVSQAGSQLAIPLRIANVHTANRIPFGVQPLTNPLPPWA